MLVICRSPKGGVATSVVAAALALCQAHAGHPTVPVDLAGDQPDLFGVAPSSSLGIGDWAAGGDDVPVGALTALELEVVSGGGRVTVVVRFDPPIIGALVGDLALDAEATMRLER